jgi:hypothetical protein
MWGHRLSLLLFLFLFLLFDKLPSLQRVTQREIIPQGLNYFQTVTQREIRSLHLN